MARKILTLCLVRDGDRVLLGMKKRGFGAGRWNGFGGKVEPGETVLQGAFRELREEAGLIASEAEELGVLDFTFENDPKILEVHIYRISAYTGDPVESEEMRPQWFPADALPFSKMWPDDEYWMPLFLADKKFTGTFHFDAPSSPEHAAVILRQNLSEV